MESRDFFDFAIFPKRSVTYSLLFSSTLSFDNLALTQVYTFFLGRLFLDTWKPPVKVFIIFYNYVLIAKLYLYMMCVYWVLIKICYSCIVSPQRKCVIPFLFTIKLELIPYMNLNYWQIIIGTKSPDFHVLWSQNAIESLKIAYCHIMQKGDQV